MFNLVGGCRRRLLRRGRDERLAEDEPDGVSRCGLVMTGNRDRRNLRTKRTPQDAATGQLGIVIAVSSDADYDATSRPQFERRVLDVDVGPEGKIR